ncbi:uncharacterized protein LOC124809338 [Hydra vulgaris]|uniref:uncharacterized protein LOC124809338 n=1 Tax=Hydra vulgaris TaxID=6087 RepID=UPI001F5F17C9|nr:uncharacterized protein LOC124809338 [Hydra vulgaris]
MIIDQESHYHHVKIWSTKAQRKTTDREVSAKKCKLITSFLSVQPQCQGNIESYVQITSEIIKARDGKDLESNLQSTSGIIQANGSRDIESNLKSTSAIILAKHPIQPHEHLPFDNKIYHRQKDLKDSIPRNWLSFSQNFQSLYCSFCVAFESPQSNTVSSFVSGFKDFRRVSQRVAEHESSSTHRRHVLNYIRIMNNQDFDRFYSTAIKKYNDEQTLPFRGHRNEGAYSLDNDEENHGNFLALEQITMEVSKAKVYSVQVDSTQDISAIGQFSIVVRYVLDATVHERLLSIVPSNDGTGQGLFDLLNLTLQRLGFNLKYCLSDSTDGASSYHGQYNGLQQKITEAADHHVHIWCYAHVLNLVVKEATSCCIHAFSFFTLLQNVLTFVKVSYKQMATWIKLVERQIGMDKMKRLKLIGETRWSGKLNAATAIFGTFAEPSSTVFVNLILCLSYISKSKNFDTKTRHEAKTLLMPFLKFDTILTAFTYLRVFEKVGPLSIYLQTRGLNVLVAFKMVEKAVIKLKSQSRLFDDVHNKALQFVRMANASIIQRTETILEVKIELPAKRKRKTPKMLDEYTVDERDESKALEHFKIHTYNVVMDQVVQSLESRFTSHRQLYMDMVCFDTSNFGDLAISGIPENSLHSIIKFLPDADVDKIKAELLSFVTNYETLKLPLPLTTTLRENAYQKDDIEESLCYQHTNGVCGSCPSCVLRILAAYRLNDKTYDNLYHINKIICTISVTQAECERSFSKLKLIKTRLHNSMSNDHLESYMLMSVEKNLLDSLEYDTIIQRYASSSSELSKLSKE